MNFPLEVDYSDPKKDKAAFVILRSFFFVIMIAIIHAGFLQLWPGTSYKY